MKPRWIRRMDMAVVATIIGLVAYFFAQREYEFRLGWKNDPPPPEGIHRIVCKMWNVDRHRFYNISSLAHFPRCFTCSFRHLHGNRGWIDGLTSELDEDDYPALLRKYLDEEMAYYGRKRPDGKPPLRIEAYIITSDGTVHSPAPKQPEKEDEK